jgi:predicted nucleic acid-binding protein
MKTVNEIAESIQRECHQSIKFIADNSGDKVSYQDATNVFLMRKLAELQFEVNYLNTLLGASI